MRNITKQRYIRKIQIFKSMKRRISKENPNKKLKNNSVKKKQNVLVTSKPMVCVHRMFNEISTSKLKM